MPIRLVLMTETYSVFGKYRTELLDNNPLRLERRSRRENVDKHWPSSHQGPTEWLPLMLCVLEEPQTDVVMGPRIISCVSANG